MDASTAAALVTIRESAMAANSGNEVYVDMVLGVVERLCQGASMASTEARSSGGGIQFKLDKLIEALLMGRLLKNQSDLPQAFVRSVGFLLGPQTAESLRAGIASRKVEIPSASSLSRARLKADCLLMRLRS